MGRGGGKGQTEWRGADRIEQENVVHERAVRRRLAGKTKAHRGHDGGPCGFQFRCKSQVVGVVNARHVVAARGGEETVRLGVAQSERVAVRRATELIEDVVCQNTIEQVTLGGRRGVTRPIRQRVGVVGVVSQLRSPSCCEGTRAFSSR